MKGLLFDLVLEELEDQHGFLGSKDCFTETRLKMLMQMEIGRTVVLFFKPDDSDETSRLSGLLEQFDQIMALVKTLKYDEHRVNKEELKKALVKSVTNKLCPRCSSHNVELLPTDIPEERKDDYEQYSCNGCNFIWDTDDEELGKIF